MAVVEGIAMWASVLAPNERFDHMWTINVVIDEDEAKSFSALGHKVKETEMGPSIVIKRKVLDGQGNRKDAPRLVDASKAELKQLVGNGSRVRVQYEEWSVTNSFGSFKGLDLKAVQVLDLVEWNPGLRDGEELGISATDEF